MTDKPFGVNIMLLADNVEELIDVVCEEKVPVVTTGAGNPGKYIAKMKEAGIKVVPVVANLALATRVERAGADAVVAEGTEAGGHIGETTTMALVPQMVDALNIPVIAAGGIADGRGIAAAYMLGAQGVQVGTRFLVANECIVAQGYKDAIIKAKDSSTVATGRSTGHPVRIIKNKLARKILSLESRMLRKKKSISYVREHWQPLYGTGFRQRQHHVRTDRRSGEKGTACGRDHRKRCLRR